MVKEELGMFFRKEVRVTRDLNECNGVRNILSNKGIRTFVITNTPTYPGRYHGVPFINPTAAYQYHIYVGKKDEEEALRILKLL